ncbi:1-acyl-sn-glycerol-3-phosphate acyltransferase [Candidatus Saganbacteria bacterium CG08_land_8_20_14_0_20_45_16]|uniref:1-acyl-sn-glycerol-3-phosphate acyltransferase n=1 Tax=Candidatus Saganbacteria bacterium CG08_land_8_20_14_0_20_45_16 TaxID=2014293 RepID=A0A2H0XZ63_UNCSA|nr:MAG: 1-acyl-sn-glycerol-3-phosphate acyltransferase [Candidatus Saganbacteria bacterium CG08_land_8_20_14_0_20_45_16]
MNFLRTILFYLILVITFFVGSTIALISSLFIRPRAKAFQVAAHIWAKLLVKVSGIRCEVRGAENIPKDKAVIFAANHQGAADILIVLACLPTTFRFAIKKELFKVPVFGWYLRSADYFPIDRKLILSVYRTVENIIGYIKEGASVLIFPEGTRTQTGELGKFKRGSLLAALKSGAPIVPLAISGSFDLMPKGSFVINPHPVKFSIGKPIEITNEADYESKVEEVRSAIEEML